MACKARAGRSDYCYHKRRDNESGSEGGWWVSLTQIEARSLSAIAVSGELSLRAICPRCRLHGQVTADAG